MATKITKKDKTSKITQMVSDAERTTLRKWNLRLGFALLAQAAAVVIIGAAQTVPITIQYLATDTLASEASGNQVLAVATRHILDMPLSLLVAKFLLIFAVVYILSATMWRGKYEAWLERGVNKLRWLAFGVGGGSIAITAAVLGGISDIAYLWLIFGSVALAGLLALVVELLGPERRLRRLAVVGGIFAAALPWIALIGTTLSVILFDGYLPAFVYYVYASTFLLFVAAGLATYFRVSQRGKWANTVYAERMFMVLGFVAASVLAWQIFAGALQA